MPKFLIQALALLAGAAAALAVAHPAEATPKRIILLRHAEKLDDYALCDMGKTRAEALRQQFLGRGATQSLFGADGGPDALMAITLHTFETITPLARSWGLPVIDYAAVPEKGDTDRKKELDENTETGMAAHDLLTDPRYDGKTVVMVWEHKRIAGAKFEAEYPGQQVTLRQLLHLDKVPGVPETWPENTYDTIWIVDYRPGNPVPSGFRMVREAFSGAFAALPANEWGTPEPAHIAAGCLE